MAEDLHRRPAAFARRRRRRAAPSGRRRTRPLLRRPHDAAAIGDIWITALRMIDDHGINALRACARRADESLAAGDPSGCVLWYRVVYAIDRWQAPAPATGEAVH
jgi:hypothetical protein